MVVAAARERARGDIVSLVHRGLGELDFALAATRALRAAVPFDGVCVVTLDPATGLPTGEMVENGLPDAVLPRLTEIEMGEPDVNKFAELARRPRPAASLSAATEGDLDRSLRQRELRRPSGFGDELRAALIGNGAAWGALTLMRETGRAHFTATDVRFVASMSGLLAEGLRRALLVTSVTGTGVAGTGVAGASVTGANVAGTNGTGVDVASVGDWGTGLLVLADDGSIELANPAARRWLRALGTDDAAAQRLPVVVRAVARRARDAAAGIANVGRIARARLRTASGQWLLVHGSLLGDGPAAPAAVILEAARAPELATLVADAYGLTEREQRVAQLVASGLSTGAIAGRLHLSPYTVQDHLKAIFEKTGVGTRGELVARIFIEHSFIERSFIQHPSPPPAT